MNGDEIRFLNLCAELMFSLGLWVTVTGELEALASRPVCEPGLADLRWALVSKVKL